MDDDGPVVNEDQFWDELEDIVSTPCRTHERIDDTLRTWLGFIATNKEAYVQSEHAVLRVSYALLSSSLFSKNEDYIRLQITYALLQEDDPLSLHLAAAFLLLDGRRHEPTFELMNGEGAFSHLVSLIRQGMDDELGLHRRMLELLYEMSRIQQIASKHLTTVDDEFVLHLFETIEGHADDVSDPYHYPVIRVLLVLNEQYMISTHDPTLNGSGGRVTNRVIKMLSIYGHACKTFGENLILLLNRESETSLQLLILKLLYLLFTTPSTQEYFYTNDLYVLIDILIRNLLDLPPNSTDNPAARIESLRHTYLRVLHPLLAHTQLRQPPHYKTDQLRHTLHILADAGTHFEHPDETTLRLVGRCLTVPWLKEPDAALPPSATTAVAVADATAADPAAAADDAAPLPAPPTVDPPSDDDNDDDNDTASIITTSTTAAPDSPRPPAPAPPRAPANGRPPHGSKPAVPVPRRRGRRADHLGLQPLEAQASALSVQEVAEATEKPGVLTPSKGGAGVAGRPQPPAPPPVRGRKKSPFGDAT